MKYRAVHRFFIPSADTIGSLVVLPDDEAAHLTRVLRLKAGDSIRVFDGQGREWQADVEEVQKQQVTVRLGESVAAASEPRVGITLAVAVLKGVKMDDVVRDAVMLGVRQIVPILTERTEISANAVDRSGRISRWRRIALASVKQSGRAVVPPVMKPLGLADALDASSSGMRLMLVEPNRQAPARSLGEVAPAPTVTILVGPEGGWTEHEVDLAHSAGAILATLGHQTLRADAVPVVAIAAVRALWNDL